MKYISSALLIIFLIVVVKSKDEVDSKQKEVQEIRKELTIILEKHDESIYTAFFSLLELRPFSILQFKQNVDIYTGKWISPKEYLSNLNSKEKDLLLTKVAEFISTKESSIKNNLIEKIKYWCINHKQFDFIVSNYNTPKVKLVEILENIDLFSDITNSISNQGPNTIDRTDSKQIDEAITNAKNILSNQHIKEQMIVYSKIYNELSLFVSN